MKWIFRETAKFIPVGTAVYIQNNSIHCCPTEDWGWSYIDGAGHNLILALRKEAGLWKAIVYKAQDFVSGKGKPQPATDIHITELEVTPISDKPEHLKFNIEFRKESLTYNDITLESTRRIPLSNFLKYGIVGPLLLWDSGYYPSQIVALLGARDSGKSCWLYALQTSMIRRRLSHMLPCHFEFSRKSAEIRDPLGATPPDLSTINFCPLRILDQQGHTQNIVYFLDLAGEIGVIHQVDSDPQSQDNEHNYNYNNANIRSSIQKYASGLLVFRNQNSLENKDTELEPNDLIRRIIDGGMSVQYICNVITEADKIQAQLKQDPAYRDRKCLTSQSPVFQTLEEGTDYLQKMYQHIAIAQYLLTHSTEIAYNDIPCFLVSSCQSSASGLLNFMSPKNVELPAAYMLEQLVDFEGGR